MNFEMMYYFHSWVVIDSCKVIVGSLLKLLVLDRIINSTVEVSVNNENNWVQYRIYQFQPIFHQYHI